MDKAKPSEGDERAREIIGTTSKEYHASLLASGVLVEGKQLEKEDGADSHDNSIDIP